MANIIMEDTSPIEFDWSFRKYKIRYTIELEDGETYTSTQCDGQNVWCNVKKSDITAYRTPIELSTNNSFESRSVTLTFTFKTSLGTYTRTVEIIQGGFVITPIWESTPLRIQTDANFVKYSVRGGNNVIFSGRAYVLPNNNEVEIDVAKICASYLNSSLEGKINTTNASGLTALDGVKTFVVYVNDEQDGRYLFFNSYAYNTNPPYKLIGNDYYVLLSDPIRKVIDRRQLIMFSFFKAMQGNVFLEYLNYPTPIGDESMKQQVNSRVEYTINEKPLSGYDKVEILGEEYEIKDTCCKYCLYYLNSLGGWDSFLINGNDKRTDNITQYKYIKSVPSNSVLFGTKNYMNIINTTYKLYTDWMNDEEASKMFNLLESTEVYLHNLEEDKIIPVIITNKNCEFKTFKNNGRKKFYYTIEVEEAQHKIRQ